eukprot:scaffold89599_cov55-Attheya_sp.AAC.1
MCRDAIRIEKRWSQERNSFTLSLAIVDRGTTPLHSPRQLLPLPSNRESSQVESVKLSRDARLVTYGPLTKKRVLKKESE